MAISLLQHSEKLTKKVVGTFDEMIPVRAGFSEFFPRETTPSLEIDVEVQRDNDLIAVDVQRFTEGNPGKITRLTEHKYIPPYFKQEYYFNLDAVYMNTIAQGVMNNPNINRQLGQNALKNMNKERLKIERAIRKQQAQVLQTGIVTMVNGDNINYRRKAGSIVDIDVAGVYWSDAANATPLKDIQEGLRFLRDEGNSASSVVNLIMRSEGLNALTATAQFLKEADVRRIDRVTLSMPQFSEVSGMAYHGQIGAGDFDVNLWTYNEKYTDASGNTQFYLDANKAILLPGDFQGKTVFGGLPSLSDLSIGGQMATVPTVVEAEYLLRPFANERTMQSGLELTSAPLVIPFTIDKIYTMKVLA
ncbi:putative major capsid protein [Flavobacterium phage FCOV-S2]|nr:putative major capsid protein [Flavobacterium phage FCOV-S1]QCW21805.1 putative major capsid protein [Flavobacterium phage FCOV-S2]